ncbi:MAG: hypothetical protein ACJ74H_18810 [Thermoanaerobaculia bacterium]
MGNHDFDFLFEGEANWRVHNRRLREPLAGSSEWVEFDSTYVARPIWGGAAHMDEYEALHTPWGEIHGMTLRLYDEQSGQWAIYWANRNKGRLDPPMYGAWKDGHGEFYDQELFRGRMVYVRFLWFHETEHTARWEQAFSDDGGKTWETNWIMEKERVR